MNLEVILGNLFIYHEYESNCDTLITIINKLLKWYEIRTEFINILVEDKHEEVYKISSPLVKKYLIDFVNKNLNIFISHQVLFKLIKSYIIDENSGVYEKVVELISAIVTKNEYKKENNFFTAIFKHLDSLKQSSSILLIREVECLILYLTYNKDDSEVESLLKKICASFIQFDLLTSLAFLETIEKCVTQENIANFILREINFFQLLDETVSSEVIRKMMYTISKFYARKFITDTNLIKNFLGISIQYYEHNKYDSSFIISIIYNTFHNNEIFSFLMDSNNNSILDFQANIIQIIVENYFNSDPKIKQQTLEIFTIIGNFTLPSLVQEQFLKKVVLNFYHYDTGKVAPGENEAFTYFVEKLYKDFRTHDYEEYESIFLDTFSSILYFILGLISHDTLIKKVTTNFDLMLYLLNRRTRPQEILEKKFKVLEKIFKSNTALSGGIEKSILDQVEKYVKKGIY